MNSGYSKTPLEKKLGLKNGFNIKTVNTPKDYRDWFLSLDLELAEPQNPEGQSLDFIHIFCITKTDLETSLIKNIKLLKYDGMMWISWPKGSSSIATELKREPVREMVLSKGLVDVKVAAINEDWSGLKFVYRLKDRK